MLNAKEEFEYVLSCAPQSQDCFVFVQADENLKIVNDKINFRITIFLLLERCRQLIGGEGTVYAKLYQTGKSTQLSLQMKLKLVEPQNAQSVENSTNFYVEFDKDDYLLCNTLKNLNKTERSLIIKNKKNKASIKAWVANYSQDYCIEGNEIEQDKILSAKTINYVPYARVMVIMQNVTNLFIEQVKKVLEEQGVKTDLMFTSATTALDHLNIVSIKRVDILVVNNLKDVNLDDFIEELKF